MANSAMSSLTVALETTSFLLLFRNSTPCTEAWVQRVSFTVECSTENVVVVLMMEANAAMWLFLMRGPFFRPPMFLFQRTASF